MVTQGAISRRDPYHLRCLENQTRLQS